MSLDHNRLKNEIKELRAKHQLELIESLAEFDEVIRARQNKYLKRLHEILTERGIKINYIALSNLVKKYREIYNIPFRNKRQEMRISRHTATDDITTDDTFPIERE